MGNQSIAPAMHDKFRAEMFPDPAHCDFLKNLCRFANHSSKSNTFSQHSRRVSYFCFSKSKDGAKRQLPRTSIWPDAGSGLSIDMVGLWRAGSWRHLGTGGVSKLGLGGVVLIDLAAGSSEPGPSMAVAHRKHRATCRILGLFYDLDDRLFEQSWHSAHR